jgi:16S rRNA processing protein RimM
MRDISELKLVKAGRFVRTHGYKGAVILVPETDFELLSKAEPIFVLTDGIRVPFFLSSDMKKHKNDLQVLFESFESNNAAEFFLGKEAYIEEQYAIEDEEFDFDDMLDFEVFDYDISVGVVDEFLPLPTNPILSVKTHRGTELLIPVNTPFLIKIDEQKRQLFFELPAGLFDINAE